MAHRYHMRVAPVLALTAAAILALGCSQPQAPRASADRSGQLGAAHAVIEAREISGAIAGATQPLVILDVRSESAYAAGHLPGAVRIEHRQWESDSLSEASGLEHESFWTARIGALGIDGSGTVLIYDGGSMTDAARIWFILQGFGAADVRVVNGGFPSIEREVRNGSITLSSAPERPSPVTFAPAATGSDRIPWIGRQELKTSIESDRVQILDARTVREFQGADLRGNARGGHLPGASSVPHSSLLDDQGRLKSPQELSKILEGAGLVRGTPIVTHCQAGGRAALAALAAARAGYGPVTSYYLSFGDWAPDATCPVVVP